MGTSGRPKGGLRVRQPSLSVGLRSLIWRAANPSRRGILWSTRGRPGILQPSLPVGLRILIQRPYYPPGEDSIDRPEGGLWNLEQFVVPPHCSRLRTRRRDVLGPAESSSSRRTGAPVATVHGVGEGKGASGRGTLDIRKEDGASRRLAAIGTSRCLQPPPPAGRHAAHHRTRCHSTISLFSASLARTS